ncbi:MAG TPA: NUDIX hydrolase [Gemmatimonadaceae bacterium]
MPLDGQYLKKLPRHAQRRGSARNGEAEIVTSRRELDSIASECAEELSGSALGKGGKKIGILLEDEVRMVVRDALRFPTGATRCEMRIVGKTEYDGPNGVVVLCVADGKFVLREIYRHATRAWELEKVRGRRERGQTARQAARAEVKQELGYPVRRLHPLGTICPDTAVLSSTLEVFLAELGKGPRRDEPEESETFGDIHRLTPMELGRLISKRKIRDSYTVAAMLFAQLRGLVPPVRPRST